ncbi:MAG: DHH family phosphoesterase [Gemmataceae bacterium]
MAIDWAPFVELVRRHKRFVITTHVRPDGDGLGSMLALDEVLRDLGKEVHLTIASTLPPRYSFLDPGRRVQQFEPPGEIYKDAEVALVLDTGTWNQLGSYGPCFAKLSAAKAVIDHHLTQDDLGAQRFIDTTAEATGRLIYEAITALERPLPASAANALFAALSMDTGWFRHSNTTTKTFALAAELVEAGATPESLYYQLFEQNRMGRLKLMGLILGRLQVTMEGKIAYTELLRGDYEATGSTPQDCEDLVNYTLSLQGVEVGLFFMEQPRGGVKVSFRSRSVDVARVAEQFGGGGHRPASGATLTTSLDDAKSRVLHAVRLALQPAG